MALGMLHEHVLGIYSTVDDHPHLSDVIVKLCTRETVFFCPNWAHMPKMGHTLGPNTTSSYADELALTFDTGAVSKGRKEEEELAMMRHAIRAEHLCKYNIPMEQNINTFIQKMMTQRDAQKKKQRKAPAAAAEGVLRHKSVL